MDVSEAILSWHAAPVDYGTIDCCQFANHIIKAMTGRDLIPWTYGDKDQADLILTKHGGLDGAIRHALNRQMPVAFSDLKDGDPLIWELKRPRFEAVGVKVGDGFSAVLERGGVVNGPAVLVRWGWRVI